MTVSGSDVTATFNMAAGGVPANTGTWHVQICDVSCAADALTLENSSNLQIQGTSPVISGFQPAQRGKNSGDVTFALTGKGFTYGTQVSASGSGVTFSNYSTQSATQITGTMTVGNATPGTFNVTVVNTNGSSNTKTAALTVTSPPSITATSPATINIGQGAVNFPVTVSGTNLSPSGPTVSVRMTDGTTPDSINHYEFDSLDAVGTGNPGVRNVDVFGPQVIDVQDNGVPTAFGT